MNKIKDIWEKVDHFDVLQVQKTEKIGTLGATTKKKIPTDQQNNKVNKIRNSKEVGNNVPQVKLDIFHGRRLRENRWIVVILWNKIGEW